MQEAKLTYMKRSSQPGFQKNRCTLKMCHALLKSRTPIGCEIWAIVYPKFKIVLRHNNMMFLHNIPRQNDFLQPVLTFYELVS